VPVDRIVSPAMEIAFSFWALPPVLAVSVCESVRPDR
jgi:hypothetical protein